MLPPLPLSFVLLTAGAWGFPVYDMTLYPPMYMRDPFGALNETQDWHHLTVGVEVGLSIFYEQPVLAEMKGLQLKYRDAPNILAGKNLVVLPDALSDPALDARSDAVFTDTTSDFSGFALSASISISQQPNGTFSTMNVNSRGTADSLEDLNLQYYGPLGFGQTIQQLSVVMDTGAPDLWVPVGCSNCGGAQYAAGASSTYKNTGKVFQVAYGTGNVQGTLAYDTVSVGGLGVSKQFFGAVTQVPSEYKNNPSSGVLGLSFSSIAASKKPTFFENLITQNKIDAPFFSVHLTRKKASGSEVNFGCYDASKAAGPLTWVSVISKTYWTVHFDGVVVEGQYVTGNLNAAIDTGTSLIYVPWTFASSIYADIPGAGPAVKYGSNFFYFPCNSNPTITLSLGGHDFGLSIQDFNLGEDEDGSGNCIGGIVGMDDEFMEGFAIIGNEFLKSWYSVYDYSHGGRVGFAPSINNAR